MPSRWVNYSDQDLFTTKRDNFSRYKELLYYAMLILFQNEMGPVNNREFFMMTIMLSFSVVFNALVFGDIYTAWDTLTLQDRIKQDYIDSSKEIMDFFHLNEAL